MRRFLITAAVLIVIVAAGVFGIDRAVAAYAEDQIRQQTVAEVSKQGMKSDDPRVDVGGFPFINQVIGGKYDKITIVLDNLAGQGITLPELTLEATGVNAPLEALRSHQGSITADKVTGHSVIPWASVVAAAKLPELQLSANDDGTLKVSGTASFAGLSVPLTGAAQVTLATPTSLRVRVTELGGTDPNLNAAITALIDKFKERLVFTFQLPKLPYNLKLSKVQPTPAGLDISGYADDVPLTKDGATAK
ncbi:LmeA family phospholipid-binding protein [Hamadaea tsunoensis]|uniref:LmeA family phospholipid-binding protein n=1 Tax=Hamadaea tsunoensis TaxID=53368 RepID=UPI00041AF896|nr:DUF2993 domain-containing protein [Hamadaea tsunoensis]